jgi:GNAT superfamily N-acetyltransferase
MEFVVGYDWETYKRYYVSLNDLHAYYQKLDLDDVNYGDVRSSEERIIKADPSHLIVWLDGDEVVGHVVWHETSTEEHHQGDPRDEDDRSNLRMLFDGKRENLVELHEVWLRTEHRRKGFGKQFFSFFEKFIRDKGFEGIIYYTENPAGIAICRQRGYREAELKSKGWKIFAFAVSNR